MNRSLIGAIALAGYILSPVASAQGIDGSVRALDIDTRFAKTVDISGFNLDTSDGVARAHRRIVSTAYQVCAPILSTVSADKVLYRSCIAESVDNAILQTNQTNLLSFHFALPDNLRAHIWKPIPDGWQPTIG
ncbi:MAG: UrcA family protein [Pseudomonadota bacterium]